VRVWGHNTSLTTTLFIVIPVPRQESGLLCICMLGVSSLPLSRILIFDFGNGSDSVVFVVFPYIHNFNFKYLYSWWNCWNCRYFIYDKWLFSNVNIFRKLNNMILWKVCMLEWRLKTMDIYIRYYTTRVKH